MLYRGELLLVNVPGADKVLPLLGLQCSLPFLMVLLAMIRHAPHIVFLASAGFAMGYTLPYIAAQAAGGQGMARLGRLASSRLAVYIQALALLAAGLYTLHETTTVFKAPA